MSAPRQPLTWAHLDWQEQVPVGSAFGDVYFSRDDGLAESEFVFLAGNDLAERWRALPAERPGTFVLGETGFGTGLNVLAAWRLWRQCAPASWRLRILSVERFPLRPHDLARAHRAWPALAALSERLRTGYPPPLPGHHWLSLDAQVDLTLLLGDAATCLAELAAAPGTPLVVDAWMLDGFAPAKNPALWSEDLFAALAALSAPGTTVATFTCAGTVRRGLAAAGFAVHKRPGFGRKREMLSAVFNTQPERAPRWDRPAPRERQSVPEAPSALVIGGGIAGVTSARALARRGWQVTLLEAGEQLGAGASGNPQAALYAKLSPLNSPVADWNLAAWLFAQRYYAPWWAAAQGTGEPGHGARCGVLQLLDANDAPRAQALVAQLANPALAQWLDRDAASTQAGLAVPSGGLWLPGSGWLAPATLLPALAGHPGIEWQCGQTVARLVREGHAWQALGGDGQVLAQAAVAVVAGGVESLRLLPEHGLRVQPVRGQISTLPATDASADLRCVLCAEGYLTPAQHGQHCLGASFAPGHKSTALQPADDRENLARLAELVCAPDQFAAAPDGARAGIRAATPDRLPLVGPVPVASAFDRDFSALRRDARRLPAQAGSYYPDLYLNSGHGSRGYAYAPLAAEWLADQITGVPTALTPALQQALWPARLLIRDLAKGRR